MTFSNKIFKLEKGKNVFLFPQTDGSIELYLFDKSLNFYSFSTEFKPNCIFLNKFNLHKIIKLNSNHSCVCYGEEMTIIKNEEIV